MIADLISRRTIADPRSLAYSPTMTPATDKVIVGKGAMTSEMC